MRSSSCRALTSLAPWRGKTTPGHHLHPGQLHSGLARVLDGYEREAARRRASRPWSRSTLRIPSRQGRGSDRGTAVPGPAPHGASAGFVGQPKRRCRRRSSCSRTTTRFRVLNSSLNTWPRTEPTPRRGGGRRACALGARGQSHAVHAMARRRNPVSITPTSTASRPGGAGSTGELLRQTLVR